MGGIGGVVGPNDEAVFLYLLRKHLAAAVGVKGHSIAWRDGRLKKDGACFCRGIIARDRGIALRRDHGGVVQGASRSDDTAAVGQFHLCIGALIGTGGVRKRHIADR